VRGWVFDHVDVDRGGVHEVLQIHVLHDVLGPVPGEQLPVGAPVRPHVGGQIGQRVGLSPVGGLGDELGG